MSSDSTISHSSQAANVDPTCSSGVSPPKPVARTSKKQKKSEKVVRRNRNGWCTPESVLEPIREFFGGQIDLDPCSNEHATVHAQTEYRLPTDGLAAPWFGKVFVNPPFGRDTERGTNLDHWVRRCVRARREEGAEVIALIPAAFTTKRWHDYIFPSATAVFIPRGRIEFVEPPPYQGNFSTEAEYEAALDEFTSPDRPKSSPPMGCALIYWGDRLPRFIESFGRLGRVWDLQAECPVIVLASKAA